MDIAAILYEDFASKGPSQSNEKMGKAKETRPKKEDEGKSSGEITTTIPAIPASTMVRTPYGMMPMGATYLMNQPLGYGMYQ